jgi:hypothetical protein
MTTTFRARSRPTKMLSKYARTGWTPERKFIQAVAIQRWRPWEHSTGPRTARGKEQAALNAYNAYLSRLPMDKLLAALKRI